MATEQSQPISVRQRLVEQTLAPPPPLTWYSPRPAQRHQQPLTKKYIYVSIKQQPFLKPAKCVVNNL